jgi:hypothetical protein
MLEALIHLVKPFGSIYADSATLRTAITFAHIAGLLGGGGCAIAADRAILAATRLDAAAQQHVLGDLAGIHRVVLIGLGIMIVSGLLLLAGDAETYLYSRVYWTKMAMVVLLLINGLRLVRAEHAAEAGGARAWSHLRLVSIASLALWFLITLMGAALPNV